MSKSLKKLKLICKFRFLGVACKGQFWVFDPTDNRKHMASSLHPCSTQKLIVVEDRQEASIR